MREGRVCVLAASLFNTCIYRVLGRAVDTVGHLPSTPQSVTDLVFAGDAVILAESLVVLVYSRGTARRGGVVDITSAKTQVKEAFGGLPGAGVQQSVHVCSEAIEVLHSFTRLGREVRNSLGSHHCPAVLRTLSARAYGVVNTYTEGQGFTASRYMW